MFLDPHFWVAAAFFVFIALVYRKVASMLANMLDGRAAKIRTELEEAKQLREEAEQLLAVYKQKQNEYIKEAELMLQQARSDAEAITARAEQELTQTLDARMQHALEKIDREEAKIVQEARNHLVDIVLTAARTAIARQASAPSQEERLQQALSDIERKLH